MANIVANVEQLSELDTSNIEPILGGCHEYEAGSGGSLAKFSRTSRRRE